MVKGKEEESTGTQEKDEYYQGKYSKYLGAKTPEEYIQRLEKVYTDSTREAGRLLNEGKELSSNLTEREAEIAVITKIVNTNPNLKEEFQKNLYGSGYESRYDEEELSLASVARVIDERLDAKLDAKLSTALKENPALKKIEEEDIENNRQIFSEFEKEHPELVTDIKLQNDLDEAFQAVAATMAKKGGKVDFNKALNKAWRIVADDDKEYEKLMQKEANSMSSGGSSAPKNKGKTLTPAEQAIAKKFGFTEAQYLEGKEL